MVLQQRIDLEQLCADKGLRITEQRRVIARVLSESEDHPDVEQLHQRASAIDSGISIATVYRTVRLFEEAGILDRHDFGDGRARYEAAPEAHHDHLIDVETGKVVEFVDPELEASRGCGPRRKHANFVDWLDTYHLSRQRIGRNPASTGAVALYISHARLWFTIPQIVPRDCCTHMWRAN